MAAAHRATGTRRRLRGVPLLALVLVAGCYSYRTAGGTPRPDARVRILLTAESVIPLQAAGATPDMQDGVLEASGRVVAASGDTIVLRLGELRGARGAFPGLEDRTALIPASRVARITERRFDAGRTALGGAGLSLLATATLIVLLIAVLVKAAV